MCVCACGVCVCVYEPTFVRHGWSTDNDLSVELVFKSLTEHVHVQHTKETLRTHAKVQTGASELRARAWHACVHVCAMGVDPCDFVCTRD